jgi:Domain of unknown function (DUF4129)
MRSNASPEYAFAVLAACSMEAAWITLAYVMVESLAVPGPTPLSILAFACASLVGLGIARLSARHGPHSYGTPLAGIAVAVAIIGWLLPLGSGAGLVFESPMAVVRMHPGGFLLGLALLRGTAHVTPKDDERIAETALGPGVAGIALFWVLLTATGGNHEPAAVRAAFAATVTFVTAGLLSIGLARLADLRGAGVVGADRRWVGLVVGVVAGLLAVAIPLALILGVPIDAAIRGALGPIVDVFASIATLLLWPVGLLVAALVLLLQSLRSSTPIDYVLPDWLAGPPVIGPANPPGPSPAQGLDLSLVPLVAAIVVSFLLVRRLVRRPGISALEGDVVEVRETERPTGHAWLHRPHLAIPRRQRVPDTASEAYLASLEVLAQSPDSARLESETPAEHARRLRADPVSLPLSRLAADYALVEFGQRTLAPSEHRRAVERWRRLRSIRQG